MMQRLKFLKQLFVFHGSLALSLWLCTAAFASVVDAPHNETNHIKCADCHTYSLWWKYSPAAQNQATPYGTITNAVCDKCHGPNAPNHLPLTKIPHNSTSMADLHDSYLGVWATNCLDCHNPHYQDQLNWLVASPDLSDEIYLVTGTITAGTVQVHSATNTTTITYKNADADPNWVSPDKWLAKSGAGRGLMLVILDNNQGTFEIMGASASTPIVVGSANGAGTITVQGSIPTAYNSADRSFALIYGQLVKKVIATPNSGDKEVKFFDPFITYAEGKVGGAADPVTNPPQGICQVCHTKTKYYNEDGLHQPDRTVPNNPPPIAATPHNGTSSCTGCHAPGVGFRPTNADHTFITNVGTTCASCHNEGDIVTGTHLGNCEHCHAGPPNLITGFPSPKWPSTPHNNGNCYDCHTAITADFTDHPGANDHSGQVEPAPNCVGCHFHSNKEVITGIHGVDGTPCDTCHTLTPNADGTYSGTGVLVSRAKQGPANCTTCHTEIASSFFAHPGAPVHTGQVDATPQCAVCHNGDPVNDVHSWSCGMCHVAPTGLLKGVALTKGPGDCMNCHTNFYVHTNADALNHVSAVKIPDPVQEPETQKDCMECHNSFDLIGGLHGSCTVCHDQYGGLIGSAAGHAGGGTCRVCHLAKDTEAHPLVNHSAMETNYVASNPEGNCVTCHTGDPVDAVHNAFCLGCHSGLSTVPDPVTGIAPINVLIGSAAGHAGHGTNTCTDCHTAIATRFTAHRNTYDHALQVTASGTGCYNCHNPVTGLYIHADDPIEGVHKMNCNLCHAPNGDGRLLGSAAGKGTGKPPTTGNNCSACHTDTKYNTTNYDPTTGEPLNH